MKCRERLRTHCLSSARRKWVMRRPVLCSSRASRMRLAMVKRSSTATKSKAANEQAKEDASGKLVETEKSKAADEEYAGTLKTECEAKASAWEARQKSAAEEMGAIEKAKQILVDGVKAFVQVSSKVRRWNPDDDEESDDKAAKREKVVGILKQLSQTHHSFAF